MKRFSDWNVQEKGFVQIFTVHELEENFFADLYGLPQCIIILLSFVNNTVSSKFRFKEYLLETCLNPLGVRALGV